MHLQKKKYEIVVHWGEWMVYDQWLIPLTKIGKPIFSNTQLPRQWSLTVVGPVPIHHQSGKDDLQGAQKTSRYSTSDKLTGNRLFFHSLRIQTNCPYSIGS